jgi:hypothetical protein
VPFNFSFFRDEPARPSPPTKICKIFQKTLDAISRFTAKRCFPDDVCAPVHATNCWKFPKVTSAPQ